MSHAAHNPPQTSFPLRLCLASIAVTSLGLIAAAAGIQWGAAPPPGDALRSAWLYVNVMLTMAWLVVWPLAAARRSAALLWQWLALALGALPALSVAAFLAGAAAPGIARTLLLELSISILAAGMLAWSPRCPCASFLPPILAVPLPLAAYLCGELLPHAWIAWFIAVPALSAAQAAKISPQGSDAAGVLWVSGGYALVGVCLFIAACLLPSQKISAPEPR